MRRSALALLALVPLPALAQLTPTAPHATDVMLNAVRMERLADEERERREAARQQEQERLERERQQSGQQIPPLAPPRN